MSSIFFKKNPMKWKNNAKYNNARCIVSTIKAVNDTAERNDKLMEDFNQQITKNEEHLLLQVVLYSINF